MSWSAPAKVWSLPPKNSRTAGPLPKRLQNWAAPSGKSVTAVRRMKQFVLKSRKRAWGPLISNVKLWRLTRIWSLTESAPGESPTSTQDQEQLWTTVWETWDVAFKRRPRLSTPWLAVFRTARTTRFATSSKPRSSSRSGRDSFKGTAGECPNFRTWRGGASGEAAVEYRGASLAALCDN